MDVPVLPRRALFLALALVLSACPKAPPNVGAGPRVEGAFPDKPQVEVHKDATADAALARARRSPQAPESYLAVRKAYPATTAGQDALYQAGVLFFEAADYVNARKTLNELLFENPVHANAVDAKRKLAVASLETGAFRDAYLTLVNLAEQSEGAERTQLLVQAQRAAEGALLFGPALSLAVQLTAAEPAGSEAQAQGLARVVALVEGRAGFADIAKVVEGLSPQDPSWPVLTFKLARIYYHLRDWPQLEATLQRFLEQKPQHPYAEQAKAMLVRSTRRVDVKPRTVGVLLPMTGKYQQAGEAVLRGMQLALAGSDVELVVKDTQGDVTLSGQAVEQLAFDEGAIALLGPLLGDDAERSALAAEELQVPILTLTRSEGITRIGPHVFRNMLTNSAQAEAIADYATHVLGYKRFAVLYPNIPYGIELADAFWTAVVERKGVIRGAERYAHDQTTFTTEAKKLVGRYYLEDRLDYVGGIRDIQQGGQDAFHRRKAVEKLRGTLEPIVDFEAIFIPDDWRRVGLVAPALAVEDMVTNACDPRDLERIRKTTGRKELQTVTLFGSNQWSSPKGRTGLPELLERGGKFVNCSVYVDGFFVDSERPATRRFVQAFRKAYKDRDPGLLEASGYDVARMVRQVIEQRKPKNRAELREALAGLKNFDGATGKTSFDAQREAQKQLFLLSIDSKGVTELTPPPAASGS